MAAAAYVSSLLVVCALVLHAADRIAFALANDVVSSRSASQQMDGAAAVLASGASAGSKVLADEWTQSITTERFWRSRKTQSSRGHESSSSRAGGLSSPPVGWLGAPPAYDWFADPDDDEEPPPPPRMSRPVVQRTVCVRLCDGSFFPIGYGSTNLSRDAATCERRCPGAKLFVQRGSLSGTDLDGLVDLSGQSYSQLKNAYLFRTSYDAACKCKPHPWEPEAQERHRLYALEAKRRKGDKAAIAELKQIRAAKRAEARAKRERRRRGLSETPQAVPVANVGQAPAGASTSVPAAIGESAGAEAAAPASAIPAPQPNPAAVAAAAPEAPEAKSSGPELAKPLKPLTGGSVSLPAVATEAAELPGNVADENAPHVRKSSRRRASAQRRPADRSFRTGSPRSARSWVSTAFGQ